MIFVGYYVAFYVLQWRTCCPRPLTTPGWDLDTSWPIFGLYVLTVAALLAASLIDAELYIIPPVIPWVVARGGAARPHAGRPAVGAGVAEPDRGDGTRGVRVRRRRDRGACSPASACGGPACCRPASPTASRCWTWTAAAIAAEEKAARDAGEPLPDQPLPPTMTFAQIRAEIGKEMLFLLPPMVGAGASAALVLAVAGRRPRRGRRCRPRTPPSGFLGAALGALIGGLVPWLTRILGTLGFRRVAMGLGDVHLMFGVGAVVGAAGATVAFFLAPWPGWPSACTCC